jgi:hypothetical protein
MIFKFNPTILFLILLLNLPTFSQDFFDEMEIEDISREPDIKSTIIRDPEQALLIVKTQVDLMRIQSNNVIIKSEKKGDGTWHLIVMPGTHRISFQAKGFISIQQRFYFNPKDVKGVRIRVIPSAERKAEKNTGMVVIQSKPDSADVYLNEQFYGTTPYIGKLLAGRYNLKIRKQGFLPSFEGIIIKPSETVPIEIELKRTIGEFVKSVDSTKQEKLQIAVLDFKGGAAFSKEDINTITERFRTEMGQTGTYEVLSRKNMISIVDAIGFRLTGCTSQECAVEIGNLLSVAKIVLGTIGQLGKTYTITISMIDVASGKTEKRIVRDYRGEKDELLPVIQAIADNMSDRYIVSKEPIPNWWYWVGGGTIAGAGVIWLIFSNGSDNGGVDGPNSLPIPPALPSHQ